MKDSNIVQVNFLIRSLKFRYVLLYLSLIFFFPANSFAQQVKADVDTTNIRYGEEIKYTISVSLDSMQPVVFPEGQTFSPFETINFYPIDTLIKKSLYELKRTYGITHFDSGNYSLPKQFVLIGDNPVATQSFDIRVNEVVVDTLTQPMYTIKPFLPAKRLDFPWRMIGIWILGIGLLAFIIIYLFIRKKADLNSHKKELPPLDEAIQAFKDLDNADFLQQNNSKEYYSQLTNIVKRYLDRKVMQDALESTTEELLMRLNALRDSGRVPFNRKLLLDLQEVLKRSDLIKFANMRHEAQYVDQDRSFMEDMVVKTDEILPEVPEETEEDILLKQRELKKRQIEKNRKIWKIALTSFIVLLGLAYGVYKFVNTDTDYLLDETNWISSAYGYPPLIIKTPEVLIRTDAYTFKVPGTKEIATFNSGKLNDPLYIMVESLTKDPENPPSAENILDQSLDQLERNGAENLLIKLEAFEGEGQIKGLRAHGRFTLSNNSKSSLARNYELYLIDQPSALYQVLIVYKDGDKEIEKIKEQVIQSIEFKLTK